MPTVAPGAGDSGGLIRRARKQAGLSQSALASRAGTTQSAIARLECGHTSPTVRTLSELIALTGSRLELSIVQRDFGIDRSLVRTALRGLPGERLARGISHSRMVQRNRGAARGARHG